jgi:hypothetical protein
MVRTRLTDRCPHQFAPDCQCRPASWPREERPGIRGRRAVTPRADSAVPVGVGHVGARPARGRLSARQLGGGRAAVRRAGRRHSAGLTQAKSDPIGARNSLCVMYRGRHPGAAGVGYFPSGGRDLGSNPSGLPARQAVAQWQSAYVAFADFDLWTTTSHAPPGALTPVTSMR